jgi:hypothetical protein
MTYAHPGLGQKALLAKKFAKAKYVNPAFSQGKNLHVLTPLTLCSKATVSPTDQMQSPCSAKLTSAKKKHFTKYVPGSQHRWIS